MLKPLITTLALLAGCVEPVDPCIQLEQSSFKVTGGNRVTALVRATDTCNQDAGISNAHFDFTEDGESLSNAESMPFVEAQPHDFHAYTLLLLDFSNSVLANGKIDVVKSSANRFVDSVLGSGHGGQSISIGWFAGDQQLHTLVEYTEDPMALHTAIDAITASDIQMTPGYDRSTDLYGSVVRGLRSLADIQRVNNPSSTVGALALFTDGHDLANRTTADEAQQAVDSSRDQVFAIGIDSPELATTELEAIGRNGFVAAAQIEGLDAKFVEIGNRIYNFANSFYEVAYCSPRRSGKHELVVSMTNPDGKISSTTIAYSAAGFVDQCE